MVSSVYYPNNFYIHMHIITNKQRDGIMNKTLDQMSPNQQVFKTRCRASINFKIVKGCQLPRQGWIVCQVFKRNLQWVTIRMKKAKCSQERMHGSVFNAIDSWVTQNRERCPAKMKDWSFPKRTLCWRLGSQCRYIHKRASAEVNRPIGLWPHHCISPLIDSKQWD